MKKIPTELISNVKPSPQSPRQVAARFHQLLRDGCDLQADGTAKQQPEQLPQNGYTPKYEISLFGTRFFLCNRRNAEGLKVLPAYVLPRAQSRRLYARVFYKDSSLVWRSASHYINTDDEHWIGKGAVRWQDKRGDRGWFSAEETTNLPLEMQAALDDVSQRGPRSRNDHRILPMMLRNAPANRVAPYNDFEKPRKLAMSLPVNQINANREIAWFDDENDPTSLRFADGYAPDFDSIIDVSYSRSTMYGGDIAKYRIASGNRRVQYLFVAGPRHVWVVNPQPMTTELSSFGLRTVDAIVDDDLLIPGYEFVDNTGDGDLDDQIPPGFAGAVCPIDPDRADASPWNEQLPVIREFRRRLSIVESKPLTPAKIHDQASQAANHDEQ